MKASKTSEIILLLGSNKGDKGKNLSTAKQYLKQEFGEVRIHSNILSTKAVDFIGADFINQIVVYNTLASPFEILYKTQTIEKIMGRKKKTKNGNYQDRIIDIDILFFNDWVLKSEHLILPHPQIYNRAFVQLLLSEIQAII